MRKELIYIILSVGCLFQFFPSGLKAQEPNLFEPFDSTVYFTELDNKVSISVSDIPLGDFLGAVAKSSDLNISVDPAIRINVTNNFKDVKVKNVLYFLRERYGLSIELIDNIIVVNKPEVTNEIPLDFKGIGYNASDSIISFDYNNTSIQKVVREITSLTGINVILAPGVSKEKISSYINEMPFKGAINSLAFSNNMDLDISDDGYYIIKKKTETSQTKSNTQQLNRIRPSARSNSNSKTAKQPEEYTLSVNRVSKGKISVFAENAPISEILAHASQETGASYYLISEISKSADINIAECTFHELLIHLLSSSGTVYKKVEDTYIVGTAEDHKLRTTEVYNFKHRPVAGLLEQLPKELSKTVVLSELIEINGILICGSDSELREISNLFNRIDKPVPVVLIEVLIIDINKSTFTSTGIESGLTGSPAETGGSVFPVLDLQIGADKLNGLISSLNSFGPVNLGNVNQNFYVALKALETQGKLKVRSSPQLSAINGHEAFLSIGNTEYYQEESSNIMGNQNPSITTSIIYKPVKAELGVTILPFVTNDDQITLDIMVIQSDFTERISQNAPPGNVSREFKSMIRVKNQEMVLLGGLNESRSSSSGSGVPFLSRIPILKWFFSSRTKEASDSQLSIFIRPTIIG